MTIISESGMCFLVLGRRNLTDAQKTYLIGRQYEAQKMTRGASGGFRGNQYENVVKVQNGPLPKAEGTAQKVARDVGVGRSTVKRAEKFFKGVDAAEKIESGTRQGDSTPYGPKMGPYGEGMPEHATLLLPSGFTTVSTAQN